MGNINLRVNKQHLLMPCPCTKCLNHREHKVEEVQFHLFKNRIDLSYTNWTRHGEKDEPSISSPKRVNATTKFVDDVDFALDIPTDSPTKLEMVNATKDNFDEDDLVKFQELLLDAEKPLYERCTDFTKLSTIVKLLNLKGKYGASDKFFTELLGLTKKMLPAGNEMVEKTYQAKKSYEIDGIRIQKDTKNVAESLVGTLLHVLGKTKDGVDALLDLLSSSEYHKSMETIGIPPDKHETDENEEGKPLLVGKSSEVSAELFQKAHLYVIQNTDEIVPYIE
uniref:Transposase-associated domain-containing protein n=1 Tax=Tanacetum cinerariifolium TaxID=118510 RepID=A0A6L2P8U7_TANCI|nr:hypothetical protein [Tanacetum cinerariifolium]